MAPKNKLVKMSLILCYIYSGSKALESQFIDKVRQTVSKIPIKFNFDDVQKLQMQDITDMHRVLESTLADLPENPETDLMWIKLRCSQLNLNDTAYMYYLSLQPQFNQNYFQKLRMNNKLLELKEKSYIILECMMPLIARNRHQTEYIEYFDACIRKYKCLDFDLILTRGCESHEVVSMIISQRKSLQNQAELGVCEFHESDTVNELAKASEKDNFKAVIRLDLEISQSKSVRQVENLQLIRAKHFRYMQISQDLIEELLIPENRNKTKITNSNAFKLVKN